MDSQICVELWFGIGRAWGANPANPPRLALDARLKLAKADHEPLQITYSSGISPSRRFCYTKISTDISILVCKKIEWRMRMGNF